jgi:hypothetical protein
MSTADATSPAADANYRLRRKPRLFAVVLTPATFTEILDTTIANVVAPAIAASPSSSNNEATWVDAPSGLQRLTIFGLNSAIHSGPASRRRSSLNVSAHRAAGVVQRWRSSLAPRQRQFVLLQQLSSALHTRRLLALTLQSLRRPARGRARGGWQGHVHGRLSAIPNETSRPSLTAVPTSTWGWLRWREATARAQSRILPALMRHSRPTAAPAH